MKKSSTDTSIPKLDLEKVKKDFDAVLSKASVDDASSLNSKYLGKKGVITELMKEIKNIPAEKRAEFGKKLNELKRYVQDKVQQLQTGLERQEVGKTVVSGGFDVTAPFAPNTPSDKRPHLICEPGTLHPITELGDKAIKIWETMGFHVTEARHLDDDYHDFESLNIPAGHPARDLWDTFWTEEGYIPITQTSSMQNRILQQKKFPIREVIIGKCFRHEATDASHEHTFYQLEGMYVDKNATLADLIGTLSSFMNEYFGQEVKYKIQPSYFPFVEPGLEFLSECLICGQRGCPFCSYSGWIELVPCGMIHPNVLEMGGVDPKEYRGFAWAFGFDRLVMLRSQIKDIRNLHSGNIKFLEQFK